MTADPAATGAAAGAAAGSAGAVGPAASLPFRRRRITWSSAANPSAAADHVLRGGQLRQAHRSPCVQLLGGDADLGAETELLAVDGKRVDVFTSTAAASTSARNRSAERRSSVTIASERPKELVVDVRDRCIERVHHPPPTSSGRGTRGRSRPRWLRRCARASSGHVRHPPAPPWAWPSRDGARQELGRHRFVQHQRLGRVAHRGALGLGIDQDRLGHVQIRRRIRRRRGSCRHRRSRTAPWRAPGSHASATSLLGGSGSRLGSCCCMNSTAALCEVSSTSTTESSGSPLAANASRRVAAMAVFEWNAEEEPRGTQHCPTSGTALRRRRSRSDGSRR